MASPTLFCSTISTGATDSRSTLSRSWIQSREDFLPPAHPSVQIRSGFPLSDWTRSRMAFRISKTLTFWTAHRCLISSPTCRHLTVLETFGLDGLSNPGNPHQAIDRMIDLNRTANPAFQRTPRSDAADSVDVGATQRIVNLKEPLRRKRSGFSS